MWATQHKKEWQQTVFSYNEDGVSIRIPNVYAWVCPVDGEASFTPETADELITALREFIDAAKRAKERRSVLTEYVVAVE
ncbi:YgiT-type zinc finger protein [Candidatus Poribacteria bacterium]|nr:YgiT-type zinc finger protein [Candidatus Poribacteria bacterium]MYF55442.1 YgiT-type zinc finger protein [Candidatus Poribacteria bacterium]